MKTDESDVHRAPNIQDTPDIYETENVAADPERRIESAMRQIQPWSDKVALDIGAGTGFHLPRFHSDAAHVYAVEPHGPSRLMAMERVVRLGLEKVSILGGSAESLPLADNSVDLVHARFAYFFAPNCEPGVRELERVIRPGGVAFIIENDLRSGTFASWLKRSPWVEHDPAVVEQFWTERGFSITRIPSSWSFQSRADLEAVVRIEFPADLAEEILNEHPGKDVEYHYLLLHRRF